MADPIFPDKTINLAATTLNYLARQQEVIGQNISNVDTPGFQAQSLNFELALQSALGNDDGMRMNKTSPKHMSAPAQQAAVQLEARKGGAWRSDGNNVDIDIELNQMAETGIRYQAISQLVSKKFLLLRTIASSR